MQGRSMVGIRLAIELLSSFEAQLQGCEVYYTMFTFV